MTLSINMYIYENKHYVIIRRQRELDEINRVYCLISHGAKSIRIFCIGRNVSKIYTF